MSLASLEMKAIMGTVHDEPGKSITPDLLIGDVDVEKYDALLLPGGVGNPDRLRGVPAAVALVRAFADAGKPVAAICHGPWLLVEPTWCGTSASPAGRRSDDLRRRRRRRVDEGRRSMQYHYHRNPNDVPPSPTRCECMLA